MQKAEETLQPAVAAAAACHAPFQDAWRELGGAGERHSVIETLRAVVDRHRELMSEADLEGDAPPEWDRRSEALLEYRRGVDADLLHPLVTAFEQWGPTSRVEQALGMALEQASTRCGELPSAVVAPWSADALAPKPSDTLSRRAGKVFARVLSPARKAGRERSLPLRRVAVHHLDRLVVPAQDELGVRAVIRWGAWSGALERAWVEWSLAALPALVRAELPSEGPEDGQAVWLAVREAGSALQEALEALLADDPSAELTDAALARIDMERGALEADAAVAGSFLFRPKAPTTSARLIKVGRLAPALRKWEEGIAARLRLYLSLLSILSGATAVQRRVVWRFRDRCLDALPELSHVATELERLGTELKRPGASELLETQREKLDSDLRAALERASAAIPEPGLVDATAREVSDSAIEALLAMIRQAPASLLVHASDARAPARGRAVETREILLQELARQAFDALRIERIRSSTAGLLEPIDAARTNLAELETVYSFSRDEAVKELESGEPEARERAEDLVGGALIRLADALRGQVAMLEAAVAEAQKRLASEIADGSNALLERVVAGRMEARLFAARSRAADLWAEVADRWGPPVRRAWKWLQVRVTRVRRLSARALRKGGEMVGTATAETAASTRTLRALTDVGAVTERLPLVYQRLFTLQPISDVALMAGRDAELDSAMKRWKRWHDADGVPLIVRGRQGSGISSFIGVLGRQIEEDGGSVKQDALTERVTTEPELAAILAGILELPATDSLDSLASSIFHADPRSLPAAVLLDNLEHLYLRVPHGTDLIERLLTLMAETEPRIFWIGGITTSAWQLVATAEPTAISQVDVVDLGPLKPADVQAAISVRHRRSGLAIRYEEPSSGRHLLRHRLRRRADPDAYRRLLEEDYFEQLHRVTGGHLGLALYHWMMAADFGTQNGVYMHQPERPDFSVLEALGLTQNFTLKAFLEHRTLTLEEHDRIFRLPRQESYQIFESLRNRHLLEPVTAEDEDIEAESEIEEDLRYRLRPLLTGAVVSHLQARNIVH